MNDVPVDVFQAILPLERISSEVRNIIDACEFPLCVACSGGPDSMALLVLIRHYWPNKECIIFHYNHRVREASEEEERKIKAFADRLSLKIEVGHRLNTGAVTEESLRKDRYVFFEKMLRLHKGRILLLGHHQDDLFETVLMRLARGVGLEGLVAPRAIHPMKNYTKVRPLLDFRKDDLIEVCRQLGLEYFLDHTNALDTCVRNRIRRQILGKFDDVFVHNWRRGFALSCSILAEHREYLQKKLSEKTQGIDFSKKIFLKVKFRDWELLEIRYFLQLWFNKHEVELSSKELLNGIIKNILCDASISINLNNEFSLKMDHLMIEIIEHKQMKGENFCVNWQNGTLFLPYRKFLRLEKCTCENSLLSDVKNKKFDHRNTVVLDAEWVKFPLIVRNWRAGDRYCPLGKMREKKLKDLFVDNKIQKKNDIPVICNSTGDILWVPGLPPASQAKICASTKMCIFLFYQNLEMV